MIQNKRDLGGLKTKDGRVIRSAAEAAGRLELMFADGRVPVVAADDGERETHDGEKK